MSLKTFTLASAALVATTVFAFADGNMSAPAVTGKLNGETFLMDAHKIVNRHSNLTPNQHPNLTPLMLSRPGAA